MKYAWMLEDSEACDCNICKGFCRSRVCWPLPEETEVLIKQGFADRLMNDYWVGNGENGGDIQIISPAMRGSEGKGAPSWPRGRCTFMNGVGHCEIHDVCKPYEARIAHHDPQGPDEFNQHEMIAMAWNTDEGRATVKQWYRVLRED